MSIFENIERIVAALKPACEKANLPFRLNVDIAIYAHPEPLRPFALEAGKTQSDIEMPGPYEAGWMVKWRGIHVIDDRQLRKDRITITLGFAPAVHFLLDGSIREAIEPVGTELPKKYRAVVRQVLANDSASANQ